LSVRKKWQKKWRTNQLLFQAFDTNNYTRATLDTTRIGTL